jgi:hypothetical protein
MELKIIMLSEISQTQRQIFHLFSHLWNLDLKQKYESKRGTIWGEWRAHRKKEGAREGDGGVNMIEIYSMPV